MKKILVPVDFSKVSEAATHFAVDLAKAKNASVLLLNSSRVNYVSEHPYEALSMAQQVVNQVIESAEQRMSHLAGTLDKAVKVETKVSFLGILDAVKEETEFNDIDLIVMGTTGCSGWEEVLIGSNTERIVRSVKCPVISVPIGAGTRINKIMIPLDLMEIRRSFLNEVSNLQQLFDCELEFLWVKTPHNIENEEVVSTQLEKLFNEYGIGNYKLKIVKNIFPADGILEEAEASGSDMIAMATHARRGISHWLSGSLTEDTVNHVHVPVWTFKINKDEDIIKINEVERAKAEVKELGRHGHLILTA